MRDPEAIMRDSEHLDHLLEVCPIQLLDRGDGTYEVWDGNGWMDVARMVGRDRIPAVVVDRPLEHGGTGRLVWILLDSRGDHVMAREGER